MPICHLMDAKSKEATAFCYNLLPIWLLSVANCRRNLLPALIITGQMIGVILKVYPENTFVILSLPKDNKQQGFDKLSLTIVDGVVYFLDRLLKSSKFMFRYSGKMKTGDFEFGRDGLNIREARATELNCAHARTFAVL